MHSHDMHFGDEYVCLMHSQNCDSCTQVVTALPQLCRYCPLWGLYPSWFCSSGIPWNARPLFWVTTIHPPYGHTRSRVWGPHFRLGHGSDTICNRPTPIVQILSALGPHTPHGFVRVLACGAHTSGQGMALIPSVTTPPQLCRYCPLWGPYPSRFCSSPGCVGEKASAH